MSNTSSHKMRSTTIHLIFVVVAWGALVSWAALNGVLSSLYMPLIGVIVAFSIIIPTFVYFISPHLHAYADSVGHRPIIIFHTWRIPAALLFFWYGIHGELPTAFWVLAGTGDFLAGIYAAYLATRRLETREIWLFHLFGFTDFVVAVGTGLTFTLLQDPKMAIIATLPLALIPLWGVGMSGTTHLVAFDMLRRGIGGESTN